MKKFIYALSILAVFLTACSKSDLDRTIFIPDEENPSLPAYTEWGYNSFGADYERSVFVATNSIVPCKVVYKSDTLSFALVGRCNRNDMTLTFSFPLSQIGTIEDLAVLNDYTVDLKTGATVSLTTNNVQAALDVTDGQLYFKRFQLLRVDGQFNRIILSGTFDLKFLRNGLPETMSDGRFDIGITDRDFYSFSD